MPALATCTRLALPTPRLVDNVGDVGCSGKTELDPKEVCKIPRADLIDPSLAKRRCTCQSVMHVWNLC